MRFYILLTICVLKIGTTIAQTNAIKIDPIDTTDPAVQRMIHKKHTPVFLQFNTGAGLLWAKNAALSQSFSFQYSSSILNPNTQTVNILKNNYMGTNMVNANYFGMQLGVGKFYVELIEGGFYASRQAHNKMSGFQIQAGSGANIPLHIKQKKFTLQVGLGIYHAMYNFSLAQLNNTNAVINVFGEQAQATFYHRSYEKRGYTGWVNARELDIDYGNAQTYLVPKIGVGGNLFHSGFYLGVSAQYNLPIHQNNYITLTQIGDANDYSNNIQNNMTDVSPTSLSMYTNGKKTTALPYTAKGLSLTVTVGYTVFGSKHVKKKKAIK